MFVSVARNHQKEFAGRSDRRPLVRNKLRVLVVSYLMPAREKRVGEERPWASIIARVPFQPQVLREAVPATIKPMWATEE